MRLEGSRADDQSVVVSTSASGRHFDIHHLRQDTPSTWRSVRVCNALVTSDRLRVYAPLAFDGAEISGTTSQRDVDVELRRYDGAKVSTRKLAQQRVPTGRALRIAPTNWQRLSRANVEQVLA